jgi:hypothetical protein
MPPYRAKLGGLAGSGTYPVEKPTIDIQGAIAALVEGLRTTREGAIRRAFMQEQQGRQRMLDAQSQMDRASQRQAQERAEQFQREQFEEAKRQNVIKGAFEREKLADSARQRQEDIARDDLRAREDHARKLELETTKARLRPPRAGSSGSAGRVSTRETDDRIRNLNTQIDDTRSEMGQARLLASKSAAKIVAENPGSISFAQAGEMVAEAQRRVADLMAKGDSLTAVRDSVVGARAGQAPAVAAPDAAARLRSRDSGGPVTIRGGRPEIAPAGSQPAYDVEKARTDPQYRAWLRSRGVDIP